MDSGCTCDKYIVGIDEAGRGPLAGPVAVGAVKVREEYLSEFENRFAGVKDSKKLSPQKREAWLTRMKDAQKAGIIEYRVSLIGPGTIDRHGIRYAVVKGMRNLLLGLECDHRHSTILLDGGLRAPKHYKNQTTIIRGDEKEMTIALASIAAKVTRDALMLRFSARYPEYAFEEHKGYGTSEHYKRIKKYGITDVHRRSFLKKVLA